MAAGTVITGSSPLHGSLPHALLEELGLLPEQVTDFSATVNPYPLYPAVRDLLATTDYHAYPDTECRTARRALAEVTGVSSAMIAMAAGTTELIFALPVFFRRPVVFSPTYGDYAAAFKRRNHAVQEVQYNDNHQTTISIISELKRCDADLVILCNPNNPTGSYVPVEAVREICAADRSRVVCVDESYLEMSEGCATASSVVLEFSNCLVLRSLTKPYGIGGVRVGYMIASPEWCGRINAQLLPWGVTTLAQHMVVLFASQQEYYKQQWKNLLNERDRMTETAAAYGLHAVKARTPFFLLSVKNAHKMYIQLLRHYRVLVRDCTSFGMPDIIRIMPSFPKNNSLLLEVLKKEL